MEIDFRVGIPGELVTHSFLKLGVGERTFSAGDKAVLSGTFSLRERTWVEKQITWNETKEYANTNAIPIPGRPSWRRTLRPGSVPIRTGKLERTPANLSIRHVQNAEVSDFTIMVAGGHPLVFLAPKIDATLLLQIRPERSGFAAKLTGSHDKFPAYSLTINGTLLYSFDPEAAGTSPDALFGFDKKDVATPWRVFQGV